MAVQQMLQIMKTVKKPPIPAPNREIASSIVKALIASDHIEKTLISAPADETPSSLLSDLDSITFQSVIANRRLQSSKSLALFNFVLQNPDLVKFNPNLESYVTLIVRLVKERRFWDAERMMGFILRYDVTEFVDTVKNCFGCDSLDQKLVSKLFNLMFKVYSDNLMFDSALKVFDEMQSFKVEIDEKTCTVHLIAMKWAGQGEAALEFLYRMISAGVEVSVYSLTVVVDGLCRSGEVRKSLELLEEMGRKGMRLNVITFNVLIHTCCKMRLFDELELVFSMMRREDIEFALSTYKILVDGYSSCGKIDEAEEIIVKMHDQGIRVDVYLYAPVLEARCRLSKEDGFVLFGKMVERGVGLNADVYKMLLDVVCREGDVEKAKELMTEIGEKGIELDEPMFSSLIVAFCEKGLVDEAVELFNKMKSKGINGSCGLCTTLASTLCEFDRTGDAKRLVNSMIKHGMAKEASGLAALGDKIGFCGKKYFCFHQK